MGEETFLDKARNFIAALSFKVFLWANRMTKDEYFNQLEIENKLSGKI